MRVRATFIDVARLVSAKGVAHGEFGGRQPEAQGSLRLGPGVGALFAPLVSINDKNINK